MFILHKGGGELIMNIYEVIHWVNFDEYLITHNIKSITLEMIDDRTIQLDNDVEIIFNERIQMVTDTTNRVVIFEDDEY